MRQSNGVLQVKHNAEELNEGETMILTLADRTILDEKGELDDDADELENALVVRFLIPCLLRNILSLSFNPLALCSAFWRLSWCPFADCGLVTRVML